ncbi:MAG TPA: hypothetical protein VGQ63_20360 [Pseudolabrys sp.]|jgi:hypothetical protein|nr:hypothetical protein [Pseudolabrys sp.]
MKRQHTCAAALMLGCVFATPSNARPDPQATIGPVTQFCGDRVCPNYLSTTPKVIERRTVHRHPPVARPVLPKARPVDASGNPGHGLVTVATAAGIDITLSEKMAPKMQAFIADLMEIGYKPKQIHCFARRGHVRGSRHYTGNACDFDQRGWGKTANMMYHVSVLAKVHDLRDGGSFRDWGHIDDGLPLSRPRYARHNRPTVILAARR